MTLKPRSEIIEPGDSIALVAKFKDSDGNLTDLDIFPTITIIQPNGGVATGPTSSGVMRIDIGTYQFNFIVGLFPSIGTWKDIWQGTLAGFTTIGEFTFTVYTTQLPAINTDGHVHLGDDPGFNYSQIAICNINNLLKSVKARLKSSGKKRDTDEYGNIIYRNCDVYTTDELVAFIARSLSNFNEYPHFTFFTFDDTPIIEQFHDVLAQGAVIFAMGAQALIERGREFQLSDNGVSFTPPTISELLNTQMQSEVTVYNEKVKTIKANMKASPIGLGTMSFVTGASPQIRRLRFLRSRQIY